MTLKENYKMISSMIAGGMVFKLEKINVIWETVSYKPAANGVTSYVDAYVTLSVKKGAKSVTISMVQAMAFKDGKIVEEWDTYDTAGLMGL